QRLLRGIDRRLCAGQERLARLDTRLGAQHPGRTLALLRQRLEHLSQRMPRAMQEQLNNRRQQLQGLAQTLHIVSPLATLSRGYSILLDERGQAIRRASQTQPGQRLKAQLGEGELEVRVEDNHLEPVTLPLL
ncbi:exodeoxyribonuclease VII large subunit, partial [Stutzerimonas nitrititolerans]